MTDSTQIHIEKFTVRAAEVNPEGSMTLTAICTLFQEVAGNNAKDLNFDITDLKDQNMTWVLHRMDIKVKEYPEWRQEITIETWPAAGDALRAYRNYRILDKKGNELVCCLSYWMMINLDTRRPVRIPQEVLDTRLPDRKHVLEVRSDRIPKPESTDVTHELTVRKSDLDMNRHVNNAVYISWILETVDEEAASQITGIDITFMKECVYGDVITSGSDSSGDEQSVHVLTNQDGSVVAQARISY